MRSAPSSIHLWAPGIREGSGGIQAFCRSLIRALHEILPGCALHVLLKNDAPSPDDPLRIDGVRFSSVASVPPAMRTGAMALRGIIAGFAERPQCVLAAHLNFLPAVRILRKMTGVRCGGFLYGIEAWGLQRKSRIRALLEADRLISISRYTRDRVVNEYGARAERIDLLPCTFDLDRFQTGPKPANWLAAFGLKPDQPVLLTVSRLDKSERYKGHRQVLQALPRIRQMFPNLRYIIAGDGDDLPALREEVRELHLEDLVLFPGRVPNADLPDLYRLCDVFLMPSSAEGFGIVFLEALASGKPCVVGNIDASPEAIGDGKLGFAVDPRSPEAIADAVVKLLSRRHDKPWLHEPETLRREIVERFGFAAFKRNLEKALSPLLIGS